jgi:DNA damage-binding protein 1
MFNYVVTAHRPTAVPCAVTGNFTSPNELNLILRFSTAIRTLADSFSKSTRIEIHRITAMGLELVADVPIYGRVAVMELVRLPVRDRHSLGLLVIIY